MLSKIWYHLKNWCADMSEAFTELTKKCVLSSSSIQVFFYIVFAAILVGSLAGDVVVIRSLAVLILAFFMALGLGISIRNTIDIHRDCKKMLDMQHSWEKGCDGCGCCGRYSIFAPLPTICTGDKEGVDLPVDFISITVEWEDSADLWEINDEDSGYFCSISDPSICFDAVGKEEESDFLEREEAEWKWIDDGLCGGICGGGHLGLDD